MDVRTLVSSEADVADLALLFCFQHGFHPATCAHDSSRVGVSNDFVELQQIDMVGLQTAERFLELLSRGLFCPPINLGHEEGPFPVAVSQCLTHANFTLSAVVVPAVVEEVHPV